MNKISNKGPKIQAEENPKPTHVQLKAIDVKDKKKTFPVDRALSLLTMKNSQWTMADDKYEFNGRDILTKDHAPASADAAANTSTEENA